MNIINRILDQRIYIGTILLQDIENIDRMDESSGTDVYQKHCRLDGNLKILTLKYIEAPIQKWKYEGKALLTTMKKSRYKGVVLEIIRYGENLGRPFEYCTSICNYNIRNPHYQGHQNSSSNINNVSYH